MKIRLIWIGRTRADYLRTGFAEYEQRLKRYADFSICELPDLKRAKNLSTAEIKTREGRRLLDECQAGNWLVLLDEGGRSFGSVGFAKQLDRWATHGRSRIDFVIGGAYGFSEAVYRRADFKLSLSAMTFSHQMVRLIFAEQLYRAFSILRNQPYHHE